MSSKANNSYLLIINETRSHYNTLMAQHKAALKKEKEKEKEKEKNDKATKS